jgi:ABC-type multidrug transport system ATPase subunit
LLQLRFELTHFQPAAAHPDFRPSVCMHEKRTPQTSAPDAPEKSRRPRRESILKRWRRRAFGRKIPRTSRTMLPTLIQVFAGFSKVDGEIEEREIDSALGFLRYDYPATVYSELRQLYREALREPQDLNEIATGLAEQLGLEDKVLLGVQLYALISRADLQKDHLIAFYLFMTNLGVAAEAIDIVYQLNTGELPEPEVEAEPQGQPLETLTIAQSGPADVILPGVGENHSIIGFRIQDLILLKNTGTEPVIIRGRKMHEGEFIRLFDGQRLLMGEVVLDYRDVVFYFNAKKNVSSTRLFLSIAGNGNPFIEKSESKQTFLKVEFGLGITVEALRHTRGEINGQRLNTGVKVDASLADKIALDNRIDVLISDLHRRARALGGRFDLNPTRSEYLISNDPVKLREGDILLPRDGGGELLLRISCNYTRKTGVLEVLESGRSIYIGGALIREQANLADGDTITIGEGRFLRCNFTDRTIEEERNVINRLQVQDLSHRYSKRTVALDNVSFPVERGEMVCVMGPSGCGKSTLLKTLAGHLRPDQGQINLNGVELYGSRRNRKRLTPYLSYIPHEEAIESRLTVEENIDLAAAIRAPHLSDAERKRRADARLVELGLSELRHRTAGEQANQTLSGGQRKRLNAGLDMIGISDVYLFDEPTSGLSSKDSEHVLEIIRGLAHNKIVLVSIHQPSARLFHLFDKVILLDQGGKLAFFGTPQQTLDYFHRVHAEESMREEGGPTPTQPEFIFDVLETPLRDLSGAVIYEEDHRGHVTPSRRFSPSFWADRFQTYRLLEEVQLEEPEADPNPVKPPPTPRRRLRDELVQFNTLFKRAFLSKLRNRANLTLTLLMSPLLALLVSFVLRYSETGAYDFASAFHIPTYLFLSLVIGMFLGLTNSADEILRDRTLLQRERNHRIRISSYILTKFLALAIFALIQCVIYVVIGALMLSIRGMFLVDLLWIYSTTLIGVATGLVISSVVPNSKTAMNVIPLILIPQIILGGALIKYEEMNGALRSGWWWSSAGSEEAGVSKLEVPQICNIMPLRWSYEGLIISYANHNPLTSLQNQLNKRILALATKDDFTPEDKKKLNQARDVLAALTGLEAESPAKIREALGELRHQMRSGEPLNLSIFKTAAADSKTKVNPGQLYVNEKVNLLFMAAKAEQADYRNKNSRFPNVFFGEKKEFSIDWSMPLPGGKEYQIKHDRMVETIPLDLGVLFLFGAAAMVVLYFSVRLRTRWV